MVELQEYKHKQNNCTGFLTNATQICTYKTGGQLDQFQEPHFRRQQSTRAMVVSDMNYIIWKTCDNN
jgi:hypothetical protein